MSYKDLIIINNEKIFQDNDNFYCENLDLKVLPEGLSDYHQVQYIVRKSRKKGKQKINFKNIKIASNIFQFLYFIFKTLKTKNASYLLISITPYTFLTFLVLFAAIAIPVPDPHTRIPKLPFLDDIFLDNFFAKSG